MKKKQWLLGLAAMILIAVLVLLFSGNKGGGTYDNLIVNGNFERGDDQWIQDAYITAMGYTSYEVRPGEGRDGSTALYIRNDYLNDARFVQEVEVELKSGKPAVSAPKSTMT